MIMSLCGSFAVVPALSLVNGGGHPATAISGVTLADSSTSAIDPASAAAVLMSEAATLALARPKAGGDSLAAAAPPRTPPPAVAPPAVAPPAVAPPAGRPAPPASVWAPPVTHPISGPSKAGQATWLDTIPSGTCANNDAPMGAVITVTNMVGVSISCRVVSRGPFAAGRIVDVAKSTFSMLGATSRGVVSVAVSW